MILTLADMEGNETFDASLLGTAAEVRHHGVYQMPSLSVAVT